MSNENLNESNEKEKLTIEEYKKVKGFENITQKEYDEISEFMFEFAQMLYSNEFK